MDLTQVIPFAVSAVVLLWAAASGAMACSGGPSSGLHQFAPPAPAAPTAEARAARARRRELRDRILNYALALVVLAAVVVMAIGMLVA